MFPGINWWEIQNLLRYPSQEKENPNVFSSPGTSFHQNDLSIKGQIQRGDVLINNIKGTQQNMEEKPPQISKLSIRNGEPVRKPYTNPRNSTIIHNQTKQQTKK